MTGITAIMCGLRTQSASPVFNPVGGLYSVDDGGNSTPVSFTITCTQSVVWTWTRTGLGSASVASGGSATSITFTLGVGTSDRTSVFNVSSSGSTWEITLDTTGTGSVMTL